MISTGNTSGPSVLCNHICLTVKYTVVSKPGLAKGYLVRGCDGFSLNTSKTQDFISSGNFPSVLSREHVDKEHTASETPITCFYVKQPASQPFDSVATLKEKD